MTEQWSTHAQNTGQTSQTFFKKIKDTKNTWLNQEINGQQQCQTKCERLENPGESWRIPGNSGDSFRSFCLHAALEPVRDVGTSCVQLRYGAGACAALRHASVPSKTRVWPKAGFLHSCSVCNGIYDLISIACATLGFLCRGQYRQAYAILHVYFSSDPEEIRGEVALSVMGQTYRIW